MDFLNKYINQSLGNKQKKIKWNKYKIMED